MRRGRRLASSFGRDNGAVSLKDKVAVVTGGGSGIGEACCVRLAAEGARVAALDIDEEAASLTARLAGDGLAVVADVSDSSAVDAALGLIEGELGPVDVWVNNAGISGGAHSDRVNPRAEQQLAEMAEGKVTTALDALTRLEDEEWRRMLSVHLDGTFYGTRAAARSMAARGAGSIINMASICGIEGCTGHPHYSAAKGGILAFTRAVAKELIVQGVRVNAIAPGFVETPLVTGSLTAPLVAAVVMGTPQGRLGRPEEVAATVAFLAGEDAGFFVGETVSPSGGFVTV
jgi:3-oxoacyl-[acyl-carrier protein] reductase